jgi:hypothetical protein
MKTTTHNKPLGFWLAVVEHRTHDAMRAAFADQGVSRREWRLLNVIAQAPVTIDELKAAMPPRGRGGKGHGLRHRRHEGERMGRSERGAQPESAGRAGRPARRSTTEVLEALVERGWLTSADGKFAITDEGSRMTAELSERIATVRATVAAGISDEAYATTVSTLEAMARNLGWSPREHQE